MNWLKKSQPEVINTKDLQISFNETLYDYVVYAPWDHSKYVTYVAGFRLGFGPRYLLTKILDKVKGVYPETIPVHEIQTQPIPKLSEPVVRRLGWSIRKKYKNGPVEEKIKQERRRWLKFEPSPRGWEVTQNTSTSGENVYKNINRPEERWWY